MPKKIVYQIVAASSEDAVQNRRLFDLVNDRLRMHAFTTVNKAKRFVRNQCGLAANEFTFKF